MSESEIDSAPPSCHRPTPNGDPAARHACGRKARHARPRPRQTIRREDVEHLHRRGADEADRHRLPDRLVRGVKGRSGEQRRIERARRPERTLCARMARRHDDRWHLPLRPGDGALHVARRTRAGAHRQKRVEPLPDERPDQPLRHAPARAGALFSQRRRRAVLGVPAGVHALHGRFVAAHLRPAPGAGFHRRRAGADRVAEARHPRARRGLRHRPRDEPARARIPRVHVHRLRHRRRRDRQRERRGERDGS